VVATGSFLEAFQKVADMAANSRGQSTIVFILNSNSFKTIYSRKKLLSIMYIIKLTKNYYSLSVLLYT